MTFLTRLFESVRCSKNDIRVGLRFAEQSLDQSRRGRSSGFSTRTDDKWYWTSRQWWGWYQYGKLLFLFRTLKYYNEEKRKIRYYGKLFSSNWFRLKFFSMHGAVRKKNCRKHDHCFYRKINIFFRQINVFTKWISY